MIMISRINITVLLSVAGLLGTNVRKCSANKDYRIKPTPELYIEGYDTSNASFNRTNLCNLQQQLNSGVLKRDLLKGQNILTRVAYDPLYVNFLPETETDENGNKLINPEDPGLMIEILDEVARRGEFSWRDSWAWEMRPPADKSWTDLLLMSVNAYDLSVNYWYDLPSRMDLGVSFPTGWYDGSMIIIRKNLDAESFDSDEFNWFFWSQPFTMSVWMLLLLTTCISGVVSIYIEEKPFHEIVKNDAPVKGSISSTVLSYTQRSMLAFTGEHYLYPKSHAGQIFSFSLTFFSILIISAYTANLASFLVIQKQNSVVDSVESLGDIVRLGKSICTLQETALEEAIIQMYPNAIVVGRVSDVKVLNSLKDNDCDYGLVGLSTWEEYKGVKETNGDCNLSRIGRTFQALDAGFASKSDAGEFCTSIVRDVLNIHFYEMIQEGVLDEKWKAFHKLRHDIPNLSSCLGLAGTDDEKVMKTLDIVNLGGLFILHLCFLILSLVVAATTKYFKNKNGNTANHFTSTRSNIAMEKTADVTSGTRTEDIEGNTATNATSTRSNIVNSRKNKPASLTRYRSNIMSNRWEDRDVFVVNDDEFPLDNAAEDVQALAQNVNELSKNFTKIMTQNVEILSMLKNKENNNIDDQSATSTTRSKTVSFFQK